MQPQHHNPPGPAPPPPAARPAIAASGAITLSSVLPVLLVGTLAVQLRSSLHIDAAQLGIAISSFYAAAALMSVPLTRSIERTGSARAMRLAGLCFAISCTAIAACAWSLPTLVPSLAFAGVGMAATVPAVNSFLARFVQRQHLGRAFGFKQAANPLASLLCGFAVPLAIAIGWRWVFAAGAAVAASAAALVPRTDGEEEALARRRDSRPGGQAALLVLAGAFGLGMAVSTCVGAFVVVSGVEGGLGHSSAGLLVAAGGACMLVARLGNGYVADRWHSTHSVQLRLVAGHLLLGTAGILLLAFGAAHHWPLPFVAGVLVVFGAGCGWNGLFALALVTAYPSAEARATSVTQVGAQIGGAVAPLAFGLLVARSSFAVAWIVAAGGMLGAGLLMLVGARMLRREGHLSWVVDAAQPAD